MNKLMMVMGIMFVASYGQCVSQTKTAPVSVTVQGSFSILLTGPNAAGISFGPKNGGDAMYDSVGLAISDNHGIVWTISLSANPLTHTDGTTTMPTGSLQYNLSGGAGVTVPASGVINVPIANTVIYTAAPAEYNSLGLGMGLGVQINIPTLQKYGAYSTTLNITLSDAF